MPSCPGAGWPLVTCEPVIAESCHVLAHLPGAAEDTLQNVRRGIFQIPFTLAARAAEVKALLKKYADVPMDLADACLVDQATQMGTGRILTLGTPPAACTWRTVSSRRLSCKG
jgi:predicted nucleic acid-binding protein